ncbi:MAG: 5'-deoxyadenosine deaminase [Myxococcota bacterium]
MNYLLKDATILTMNPKREVLRGDVIVRDGRISEIGEKLLARPGEMLQRIDLKGKVLMPGFVQAHVHLCQTVFRGQAEDMELLEWLEERIWPLEAAHSLDTLHASARLGIAELMMGGTTTCLDMGTVHHTEAIFEAAKEMGFRLFCGKAMMDAGKGRPGPMRENTRESLAEAERVKKIWHNTENGRLRYAYAPRFVLSCTEELLVEVVGRARDSGCLLHTHASENSSEIEQVREKHGTDNVAYLYDLGLTGHDVVLAHCVWLTAREMKLLKESETRVAHCPSSNLKLASGVAKLPELIDQQIHLALGADGAPCNNTLDMFQEMRLAALLPKHRAGVKAVSPQKVVELATLGGADALGIGRDVGSVEVGKKADLIVISLDAPHCRPKHDLYTTLVYAARASDVTHVMIDGDLTVKDRQLIPIDMDVILEDADKALAKVMRRAEL